MRLQWLIISSTLLLFACGLKLEDISQGEDDGTMTNFAVVNPGVYRVVASDHDAYVRFTMSSGCYNLNSFSYLKMKAWASPGTEFTVELRQGLDDCRLDLWPYMKDSAGALFSHYTAKGTFDGSPDGQDVWIPMSHFNIDRTKIAQVFISSFVTVGSPEPTTSQFGNIEFTNDAPTITIPQAMPQNPTTWNCEKPYTFAITFDNQHSGNLEQILDTLKTHDAKCTIFQIAGELVENDTAMKRLIKEGHQVAHHTWTHPGLVELTEEQIRREMTLTDEALQARLDVKTKWFRPPYGQQDPRVRKILHDMGYVSVIWNIDSTDYFNQDNGPLIWSRIQARLDKMDPARTGGVLLLHNDVKPSADLVERVIIYAKSKGFREFVTMEECMAGKFDSFMGISPSLAGVTPSAVPVATPTTADEEIQTSQASDPVSEDHSDVGYPTATESVALNGTETQSNQSSAPVSEDETQTSGARFGISSSIWVAICTTMCMATTRYLM